MLSAFILAAALSLNGSSEFRFEEGKTPTSASDGLPFDEWELEWEETFDGPSLDASRWSYENGLVRNHESQSYTTNAANVRIEDGVLVLEARKEVTPNAKFRAGGKSWFQQQATCDYSSGSVETRGKVKFPYGMTVVRARLPKLRGSWPAIWFIGCSNVSNRWPRCGEIDLMEHVGYKQGAVTGDLHWWDPAVTNKPGGHACYGARRLWDVDMDAFHDFTMIRDANRIAFYCDGRKYVDFPVESATLPDGSNAFRQDFFLKLNFALGGSWAGKCGIDDAALPARFEVDSVRFYRPRRRTDVSVKPADGATMSVGADGVRLFDVRGKGDWPGARFSFGGEGFDLSGYERVAALVSNACDHPLTLTFKVFPKGVRHANFLDKAELRPGETRELAPKLPACVVYPDLPDLDGLKGCDSKLGERSRFDPRHVLTGSVYAKKGTCGRFAVLGMRGIGERPRLKRLPEGAEFFPCVDRFGQFAHFDWRGKVREESDIVRQRQDEERWLDAHAQSPIPDADRFGGWAKGPQLEATGAFRVEKVNGRWWFVDPDGHLFYSHGITCVRPHTTTGITHREKFFSWLPAADDPVFGPCRGRIGWGGGFYRGKGRLETMDFVQANLIRKYGLDAWEEGFRETAVRRLVSWGFNTIGNWSDPAVMSLDRVPYTDSFAVSSRSLVGSRWNGEPGSGDVFAPEFDRSLEKESAACAARSATDPWCLGWFVNNEIRWGSTDVWLGESTVRSPAGQPAKRVLLDDLRVRYGEVAALNAAWGTSFADWEAFLAETNLPTATPAFVADLTAFHKKTCDTYFGKVAARIRQIAPKRLYLGCRFAWGGFEAWRSCARQCDVLSANIYMPVPRKDLPSDMVDRPLLIGEFHFGSLDSGMLHATRHPAASQRDRANMYRRYVRAALDNPRIVGSHWFLWRDQALTCRPLDGECAEAGFLDVADRPYPEMVRAAQDMSRELYATGTVPGGVPVTLP